MTVHVLPAIVAILLGLTVTGAVDVATSSGSTHVVMWLAFAFSLALVARDAILGGTFLRSDDGESGRLPIEIRQGDIQIRFWQFEPVATTVAILLGLLAEQALDMRANGNDPNAAITGAMWAAFALSLFLALGGHLSRRPRHRRKRRERRERRRERSEQWEEMGEEIEARVEQIFEDIEQRFRGRPH